MIAIKNIISHFVKSTPILLTFSIIVLLCQMEAHLFFPKFSSFFNPNSLPMLLSIEVISTLLFFFAIPSLSSKIIFRVNLQEVGLTLPKGKIKTFLLTLIAFLILVPTIYYLAQLPSFKSFYTLKNSNYAELALLIALFPVYYFAEEFFFRGFLFLSLWKRIRWHSFWVTDVIFTLSHVGKPGMEILLCIPASVIFNCLTLYTKSIVPAIIVHTSMGIFCIVWINLA